MEKKINPLRIVGCFLDFFEKIFDSDDIRKSREYFNKNKQRVAKNADLLADAKSKEIYINLVEYRKYKKRRNISKYIDKNQYVDDVVIPYDKEFLIDCGAYNGDSYKQISKKFAESSSMLIGAICIEADEKNFREMEKNLSDSSIIAVNKGCWSTSGVIGFKDGLCASSRIDDDCDFLIEVDTIDNIFEISEADLCTYIKFDIEGSELQALKGAEKVINKYHPRLAVSIYHSDEDMIEIIEYIHNKYPFYKLYVRHYTSFFADTVLYCIP